MKVGIIGAMEVEVQTLQASLAYSREIKIGDFLFYEGKIDEVDVIVCLSGIGKVSAAVCTTLLIERYSPDYIINTGTAGGLGTVDIHDIVVATEVRHHDVDLTVFGYELGQQAQQPAAFFPDNNLLKLAKINCEQHNKKLVSGLVVSGDAFISEPERLKLIREQFPKALAVEMEAAAIAQVCHQLGTKFLVLRAISDKAGEGDATSYAQFVASAGKLSAQMNIDLVKKIGK